MNTPKLLSRDEFREAVFERDRHYCVVCGESAVDAHHIMERRLFPDGGYYLDNGASVCADCHLDAEATILSVEHLRDVCKIQKKILPPHLYDDQLYDKWGNPILSNGTRLKGELFFDESVQKILSVGKVLHLFTHLVKYPRTYHLPWSQNISDDDRVMDYKFEYLCDSEIVVTEKMDGENTTMYSDHIHARSVEGRSHESQSWVKQFWSNVRYEIPEGWRVCGENLYAKHSILYPDLPSYFMGFSMWNDKNVCLSWDETLEWFALLGITTVPVLYRGEFNLDVLKKLAVSSDEREGYVVRPTGMFPYRMFGKVVGKYVRKNHNQTVKHWFQGQRMELNKLR